MRGLQIVLQARSLDHVNITPPILELSEKEKKNLNKTFVWYGLDGNENKALLTCGKFRVDVVDWQSTTHAS